MRTAFCVQYGQRPAWVDELAAPNRDVFELCWAPAPGDNARHAAHFPKSTWTQGRNRLFDLVRETERRTGRQFDYLIMADDDISFDGLSHAEGMNRFEATIAKYRPAVAVPNYGWHFFGQKHVDESAEVQGIYATDLLLQALHRDVWPVLMPYWDEFDSQSWWNSGHIQNRIAGTTYAGAIVSVNTVFVQNGRSSEYPRDGRCVAADAMVREMALPSTRWHAHETPESFLPQPLRLQKSYHRSHAKLAKLWNMNHRFWQSRQLAADAVAQAA